MSYDRESEGVVFRRTDGEKLLYAKRVHKKLQIYNDCDPIFQKQRWVQDQCTHRVDVRTGHESGKSKSESKSNTDKKVRVKRMLNAVEEVEVSL